MELRPESRKHEFRSVVGVSTRNVGRISKSVLVVLVLVIVELRPESSKREFRSMVSVSIIASVSKWASKCVKC